ncbi:hypothetical protein HDV05_006756 [Chytridiales sp. JEL 0842]|nr:hypothetical protein HDV05_006756 [Chytridiales sp. JEL 0842]
MTSSTELAYPSPKTPQSKLLQQPKRDGTGKGIAINSDHLLSAEASRSMSPSAPHSTLSPMRPSFSPLMLNKPRPGSPSISRDGSPLTSPSSAFDSNPSGSPQTSAFGSKAWDQVIASWDESQVSKWLEEAGFGAHAETFIRNHIITGDALLQLTSDSIRSFGTVSASDCLRIAHSIRRLRSSGPFHGHQLYERLDSTNSAYTPRTASPMSTTAPYTANIDISSHSLPYNTSARNTPSPRPQGSTHSQSSRDGEQPFLYDQAESLKSSSASKRTTAAKPPSLVIAVQPTQNSAKDKRLVVEGNLRHVRSYDVIPATTDRALTPNGYGKELSNLAYSRAGDFYSLPRAPKSSDISAFPNSSTSPAPIIQPRSSSVTPFSASSAVPSSPLPSDKHVGSRQNSLSSPTLFDKYVKVTSTEGQSRAIDVSSLPNGESIREAILRKFQIPPDIRGTYVIYENRNPNVQILGNEQLYSVAKSTDMDRRLTLRLGTYKSLKNSSAASKSHKHIAQHSAKPQDASMHSPTPKSSPVKKPSVKRKGSSKVRSSTRFSTISSSSDSQNSIPGERPTSALIIDNLNLYFPRIPQDSHNASSRQSFQHRSVSGRSSLGVPLRQPNSIKRFQRQSLRPDGQQRNQLALDSISKDLKPRDFTTDEWKERLAKLGESGGLFLTPELDNISVEDRKSVKRRNLAFYSKHTEDFEATKNVNSTDATREDAAVRCLGDILSTEFLKSPITEQSPKLDIDIDISPLNFNGFLPVPVSDSDGEEEEESLEAIDEQEQLEQQIDEIQDVSPSHFESTETLEESIASDEVPETIAVDEPNILFDKNEKISPTHLEWCKGDLIGKGSFGRVFLGVILTSKEVMAVKQVELQAVGKSKQGENMRKKMVDSLRMEILLLRELEHDNIVQYLGFEIEDNTISLFLEYVCGGSVASMLSRYGKFDEPLVQSLSHQILSGLEYLHKRCIIHRDIKGANILVNKEGIVKISDFGISRKNEYKMAYTHHSRMSMQGTVYWMAPEVIKGKGYSAKVDIWSLGCVVLEMLTGQHPWKQLSELQTMWKLGKEQVPPTPESLSPLAKEMVEKCFTIQPELRPTAHDLFNIPFLSIDPLAFDFKSCKEEMESKRVIAETEDVTDSTYTNTYDSD